MTAVAFDTLAYTKRLQETGMEPKLAEAKADVLEFVQGGTGSSRPPPPQAIQP